jgi:hypothetical protein
MTTTLTIDGKFAFSTKFHSPSVCCDRVPAPPFALGCATGNMRICYLDMVNSKLYFQLSCLLSAILALSISAILVFGIRSTSILAMFVIAYDPYIGLFFLIYGLRRFNRNCTDRFLSWGLLLNSAIVLFLILTFVLALSGNRV